jgi:hypothetical protein
MSDRLTRRLSALSVEIDRAREELRILEEQLAHQAGVVDERRIDMLVAETPLADRDFRIALRDHERIDRLVRELERSLEAMTGERDLLLDQLSARARTPGAPAGQPPS